MDNNQFDFNNLGDNISHLVDDAIHSQNFKELNKTINNTINQAAGGINQAIKNASDAACNAAKRTPHTNPYASRYNTPNTRRSAPYDESSMGNQLKNSVKNAVQNGSAQLREQYPSGSVSGTIKSLLGYTFGGFGGIVVIISIILLSMGIATPVATVLLVIMGLMCTGGVLLGYSGTRTLSRIKRFRTYRTAIGPKAYINLEDLAKATGKTQRFLLQDLSDMMARKMFAQGHLASDNSCFMLTDEVYQQYQNAQKALEEKKMQEEADCAAGITQGVKQVLEDCDGYIKKIHTANDELPGEIISAKLGRLELVITRIREEVKKQPDKAAELRKFMNYYLPTTWKLISTYLDFEKQPIQTDNIRTSRQEIEATLDTINTAFETLLDNLFQSKVWDISSDISVLNTMFAQEGLTKDSINKKED
ncbi:MAG: 5-bromo-4-chloroindolyl phosphate hydrolysis family protein [Lachnospiraceae bacterium]|nr:5-bromo-4-chloroindolyl phosphate hydrolysis family protein [Lachnospiraceae bacterium]